MNDTGVFAYYNPSTNKITLLEDREYEMDIYHYFYYEFSAWNISSQ